jgi:hypothetical protein
VLITLERISPTTKVLLDPHHFLRLHELVQMAVITTISVVISFLILREVSDRFQNLGSLYGTVLGVLFMVGSYFYATGNGAHEVSSYLFNQFCNTDVIHPGHCAASYDDDYYFGNIVYFFGLGLSNLALVILEVRRGEGDRVTLATYINAAILALTFIAYDAFDRVAVGLISTVIFTLVFGAILVWARGSFRQLPFTVYTVVGFGVAMLVATPIRLLL